MSLGKVHCELHIAQFLMRFITIKYLILGIDI